MLETLWGWMLSQDAADAAVAEAGSDGEDGEDEEDETVAAEGVSVAGERLLGRGTHSAGC